MKTHTDEVEGRFSCVVAGVSIYYSKDMGNLEKMGNF